MTETPASVLRQILAATVLLAVGASISGGAIWLWGSENSASSQLEFPYASADSEAAQGPEHEGPMDDQILAGVGHDNAPVALESAKSRLPFVPALPAYLPEGLPLYRSEAFLIGPSFNEGILDIYYAPVPDGSLKPGIHIFQTNQANFSSSPSLTKVLEEGTTVLDGVHWRHRLLDHPHFDVYVLEAHLKNGVFVSADIRVVGMSPEEALTQLKTVIASIP